MEPENSFLARISQFVHKVKTCNSQSIEDFLENKDKVEHGKEGIFVLFEGNYALSTDKCLELVTVDICVDIYIKKTSIDEKREPIIIGYIEKYPYEQRLEIFLGRNILTNKLKPRKYFRDHIQNPIIHYKKNISEPYNEILKEHIELISVDEFRKRSVKKYDLEKKVKILKPAYT